MVTLVVGLRATGKSTLARGLAKQLGNVVMLDDFDKEGKALVLIPANEYKIDGSRRTTIDFQMLKCVTPRIVITAYGTNDSVEEIKKRIPLKITNVVVCDSIWAKEQ